MPCDELPLISIIKIELEMRILWCKIKMGAIKIYFLWYIIGNINKPSFKQRERMITITFTILIFRIKNLIDTTQTINSSFCLMGTEPYRKEIIISFFLPVYLCITIDMLSDSPTSQNESWPSRILWQKSS